MMGNRILPHALTVWHLVKRGDEEVQERFVLSPVRLQDCTYLKNGTRMREGVLYILPSELVRGKADVDMIATGDRVALGIHDEEDVRDVKNNYRIFRIGASEGFGDLRLLRMELIGGGERA